jgi:hypothetical protein
MVEDEERGIQTAHHLLGGGQARQHSEKRMSFYCGDRNDGMWSIHLYDPQGVNRKKPNKPDAVNPAIASRFHSGYHWRGVTDPERSPA